jgi:3-oxoacyl-[acyl-carrier protein] reductase
MSGRLDGKVAIVTGGGQGIGRAYAARFGQEGARVAVADMNDDNGQQVAKELEAAGAESMFVHVDVSDEQSALDMARLAHERFGRIDVLLNNAGVFHDLEQTNDTLAYLKFVLDVNMIGPWLCTRACSRS